jgi:hypothetical protein
MTVTRPYRRARALGLPALRVQILAVSSLSTFTLHNTPWNYRESVPRAVATEYLAEAGHHLFVKEAYAAESFRKSLPSTEYQERYALRFQQVTAELREEFTPLGSAGPTFHSADSQQGGSGLLQPPTTEIAPDVRFPPPPKADPRALLAKRQQHGKSSARLPLGRYARCTPHRWHVIIRVEPPCKSWNM